jgi:flagella basal body P-ring formation protein FlgA
MSRNRQQRFLVSATALLVAALGFSMKARATAPEAAETQASPLATAERDVRAFLESQVQAAGASFPGRVEIVVGSVDPRRQLPACTRVEPFMPPGVRLWGKANIGLRCREGGTWTIYLPIEVKLFAPALVTARPIAIGQAVEADDVRLAEMELTREAPGALLDPAALADRVSTRALAAGVLLRPEHLRAKPAIAQGDMVKVVYVGSGFAVATEGKALTAAGNGQPVRVQMESGRVLTGTAREGRRVELR